MASVRELFVTFGLTLGRRYTRNQKILFINEFSETLLNQGIKVQLEERSKFTSKVTNVLVGDVDKAKNIVVASYDTGSKMWVPGYKYSPLDAKHNYNMEVLNMIITLIFVFILFMAAFFLTKGFPSFELPRKILVVIVDVICALLIVLSIVGIGNRMNYNKNSASDILIYQMAQITKNNPDIAYVLCDDSTSSYTGLAQLRSWMTEEIAKTKHFYLLDCLASGETLFVVSDENNRMEAAKLKNNKRVDFEAITVPAIEKTSLNYLPNTILLCSGKKEKDTIYAENVRTKKDYKIDLDRFEKIQKALIEVLATK